MEKVRKGHLHCCIKMCKNRMKNTTTDVKFYSLPTAVYKTVQRNKWIDFMKKANCSSDWSPSKYSRICSHHFVGNESSSCYLSPSYAPSIEFRKSEIISTAEIAAIERFKRTVHRAVKAIPPRRKYTLKKDINNVANNEIHLPDIKEPLLKVDKGIQVCSAENDYKNLFGHDSTLYICHEFKNNGTCHAEVQVYIPKK